MGNVGKKSAQLFLDKYFLRYFLGFEVDEGILLKTDEKTYFFTDARYYFAIDKKCESNNITPILLEDKQTLNNFIKDNEILEVYVDFNKITVNEYKALKKSGAKIKENKTSNRLREVKSENELALIKKACEITEKAFYKLIPEIKEGMTEKEIKEKLVSLFLELGAEGESFETIVAFNENSAIPHHKTGDTKLVKNSVILIDTGCVYKGYCSDFTRTIYFGNPTEKFISAYKHVLNANLLAERKIKANMRLKNADAISRNYLSKNGLDAHFTHSLGHGIGLEIHEYPTLSKKAKGKLKDGSVFTIEPGVYFNGEFGIRIEDTVALKGGLVFNLYNDDKKLIIIK